MFRHLALRLKGMLRDGVLVAVVLLIASTGFVAYAFPYNDYNYSIDRYRDILTNLNNLEASGTLTDAPDGFLDLLGAQKQALLAVLGAHGTGDVEAEFQARLQFEQAHYDDTQAGYSADSPLDAERRVLFYERLVANQQYYVFDDLRGMPVGYYLASQLFALSPLILFLPACIAFSAAFTSARETRSRRLEKVLPLNNVAVLATDFLAGLIITLGALVVALLPAAAYQFLGDGIGDLTYPVVDIVNNQIVQTTIGGYLLSLLLLVVSGSCFLGALALFVSRFSDSRTVLLLVLVLCVLAPNIPGFLGALSVLHIQSYVPLTYLSITPIIGIVESYANMTQLDGATLTMGLSVLAASAAVASILALLADLVVPCLATMFGAGRVVTGKSDR